jgi:hypothetical protein
MVRPSFAVYKTVLSRLKDGSCGETIATSEWEELAKLYRVA